MAEQQYRWIRLYNDFFDSVRIKKLRKMAGGDTFTIIYLKLQLVAMNKGGVLSYTGLESDFASEVALDIDEDVDNVKLTLAYLLHCGLAETSDNMSYYFPYAVINTGKEDASNRLPGRKCEKTRKKVIANEGEGERDIEREEEREEEKEKDKEEHQKEVLEEKVTAKRFHTPTVEEVRAYCKERNNTVDAEKFVDFYSSKGWRVGNTPMKDWKAAVRTWEKREDKHTDAPASKDKLRYGNFDPEDTLKKALERTYNKNG